MKKALWVIAIATVVRVIQNAIQLHMLISEKDQRKRLNNELVDSLRQDNRTWLHETMKGLDKIMREQEKSCEGTEERICETCLYYSKKIYDYPCKECEVSPNHNKWVSKNVIKSCDNCTFDIGRPSPVCTYCDITSKSRWMPKYKTTEQKPFTKSCANCKYHLECARQCMVCNNYEMWEPNSERVRSAACISCKHDKGKSVECALCNTNTLSNWEPKEDRDGENK